MLITSAQNERLSVELVGGKAAALFRLQAAGIPVPESVVVPIVVHEQYRATGALPAGIEQELHSILGDMDAVQFAVRSSAVVEDGATAAWAGQFDSFLGVDAVAVPQMVEQCFAAADSERVRAYARTQGEQDPAMAVLIQPMHEVKCGGVMFTHHPLTRTEDFVIEAVSGNGEALVSGRVTPETVVWHRSDPFPRSVLMSPEKVAELCTLGVRIEALFGSPQDIEWGVTEGGVIILQSRPITTLS